MTPAKKKILNAIKSLFVRLGHCPSYEEIGKECGLSSLSSVQKHIRNLADEGYLTFEPGRPRSIIVTPRELSGFQTCDLDHRKVYYEKGNCPVCEVLHRQNPPREVIVNG